MYYALLTQFVLRSFGCFATVSVTVFAVVYLYRRCALAVVFVIVLFSFYRSARLALSFFLHWSFVLFDKI